LCLCEDREIANHLISLYGVVITFDGNTFQVSIDGALAITMPKAIGTSPAGTIGFQAKSTTGYFAYISVN
jgi:hypothetical protein